MKEISKNTCPACEYERGVPGKPVSTGNETHCLACGNSWKEYGNVLALEEIAGEKPALLFSPAAKLDYHSKTPPEHEPDNQITYPEAETTFTQSPSKPWFAMPIVACIAAILGIGVIATLYSFDFMTNREGHKGLHVESVAFEEIIRPGGSKVVKVQGMLENRGERTEPVNRIAIVLRKANGTELARWYHASKVPALKPGKKAGFVTAMAVSAPVIASVDAIIE